MINPSHEAAAQHLVAARNRGTPGPRIAAEHRPSAIADGLAIQARVAALVGQAIGGWKCSVPSEARPVSLGGIFAPTIRSASPYPVVGSGAAAKIEPEIAFVLGRDLPSRPTPYSESEVRGAVKEARFALEIIGSRYADPAGNTFAELLADNVNNQGLFVGPVLPDMQRDLSGFPVTIRTAAEAFTTRDGKHPDGDPWRPLFWLANYLAQRGDPLRAGMIVTCGSYCGIVEVPLDTPLTFAYGDLGSLAVTLTRAS